MASVPATISQCLLLLWGMERFAVAATALASATGELVEASRAELRLRRCSADLAHRANIADAERLLTYLAPTEAERWSEAAARVRAHLKDTRENPCIVLDWAAVAHREHNRALPAGWPNWRPRFVPAREVAVLR